MSQMMSAHPEEQGAVSPLPYDHVIFTDLDGVEGVLVDLNTKQYYRLNETASLIWKGLAKGAPVANIVREITELYDVTMQRAESSVENAVSSFLAYRLLRQSR
jgi:Coenzyme PQQ synthesis protein D (PqqD)